MSTPMSTPMPPGDMFAQARDAFLAGVAAYEAGRFAEAEALLQTSLQLVPGRPSTLVNLGATRLKLGRPADALTVLNDALVAAPQDVDAWRHHGTANWTLGQDDAALASYARALALDSRHGPTRQWHALTLHRLGRHGDALSALQALLADEPERAHAWLLHGDTLRALDRHGDAMASYQRAVAIAPDAGDAWSALGQLLKDQGRTADAVSAFDKALANGADPDIQRYFLAALQGRNAPPVAPAAYVQALFDGYADGFDQHLVDVLHYQAHEQVVEAAVAARHGQAIASALDLGCGSGLCGPLLREQLGDGSLVGVDLSTTMLSLAKARGVYSVLEQDDLVHHLQTTAQRHDVVVAADVFIYLGDLAPVFAGVRRVLQPGGVFAFSVEEGQDASAATLLPSLRYAHGEPYLRGLAAQAGLVVAGVQRTTLREEQRRPIAGLVVRLRG